MSDKEFISGIYPKQKRDNAPDFVMDGFSINIPQFREWMQKFIRENPGEDWVNVKQNVGRSGKPYAERDTWKPNQDNSPPAQPPTPAATGQQDEFEPNDIPF